MTSISLCCRPVSSTKVRWGGRCINDNQCDSGLYCHRNYKLCTRAPPNGDAFGCSPGLSVCPGDGSRDMCGSPCGSSGLNETDPFVHSMLVGANRNCPRDVCDVCGQRPSDSNRLYGLCEPVYNGTGPAGHAQSATGQFHQQGDGRTIVAFDPTNPLCNCNAEWVELWESGITHFFRLSVNSGWVGLVVHEVDGVFLHRT